MHPEHIRHLRSTFALLLPMADTAAALFYANLFEADPSLRPLFKGDMRKQGAMLMQMIGSIVGLLDKPHLLLPMLRALGRRHAGYGVRAHHYAAVGSALLTTLGQGLGEAFEPVTRDAWSAAYALISQTMTEAAAAPCEAPAAEHVCSGFPRH